MAIHNCPSTACAMSGHGLIWTGPMGIMNRPCGHSYGLDCACAQHQGFTWTSPTITFNGLCECRGPLARHPFHSEPLEAEYEGRHRKESDG